MGPDEASRFESLECVVRQAQLAGQDLAIVLAEGRGRIRLSLEHARI